MSEELQIQQAEKYDGNDWWTWSIWVEGPDATLDQIECVEWTLHPTFPNPVRRVSDRGSKFRLETGGWGVFPITARVKMKSGSQIKLRHYLRLTKPDGTPNTQ